MSEVNENRTFDSEVAIGRLKENLQKLSGGIDQLFRTLGDELALTRIHRKDLAERIGVSKRTFQRRIRNKSFTLREIAILLSVMGQARSIHAKIQIQGRLSHPGDEGL